MRVVIADDVLITRVGIAALLTDEGCTVLASVGDGPSALAAVEVYRPDVAVVDIRMPPTFTDEGISLANRIRQEHPQTAVLVLSQYVEAAYAQRLLDQYPGGIGYLLKERVSDSAVVMDALRRLTVDECVIDPTLVQRLLRRAHRTDAIGRLTVRELDVLAQLAEGRSNSAIAARLFITERTVESHITQVFLKLGLTAHIDSHRRVQAVLAYLRQSAD